MSDYSLPSSDEKPAYVQQKFDEIAKSYDLFNDLITLGMHRYWKNFLVRQTGIASDAVCLDLCCGTGDIARLLSQKASEGQVHGLDFSWNMLEVAKQRPQENLTYLQGDAMKIPFEDQFFDTVSIGYGLRNVSDLSLCLKDIYRVLKPNSALVSLDVGKPTLPGVHYFFDFYFFNIVPRIGKLLESKQDMFDYLPHSAKSYPDQEQVKRLMLEAGFRHVEIHDFMLGTSTIHVAWK